MNLNFVLELVLICLCVTELLALDSTKLLKFPGFECNETSGPAVEGLYDGQCIGKALQDACWAFRVCPDCQCCETVMKATDNSTFLYSFAHRQEGTQCITDSQCSEFNKCLYGICSNGDLIDPTWANAMEEYLQQKELNLTDLSKQTDTLCGWKILEPFSDNVVLDCDAVGLANHTYWYACLRERRLC
ncbi:unnamed protein product [Cyprideis torosa]|uniref:Uncharacterized protein n=1 Tax=Cyprideis torosa TaxID=163714 RepID=A0A7R8ZNR3_9CRUS|nr:unnamed protein product [Cyprideis torosa]CAG0898628.1 unnamed protein product [Cyprideis torosa]